MGNRLNGEESLNRKKSHKITFQILCIRKFAKHDLNIIQRQQNYIALTYVPEPTNSSLRCNHSYLCFIDLPDKFYSILFLKCCFWL